jgi:hypothetical protein
MLSLHQGANDRFLVNPTTRWRGREWLIRVVTGHPDERPRYATAGKMAAGRVSLPASYAAGDGCFRGRPRRFAGDAAAIRDGKIPEPQLVFLGSSDGLI